MNESTYESVDADPWFGPSYPWFLGIEIFLGILISFSNGLVIFLALRSENLRSHKTNWFVFALAVADFVFGFDKVIFLPFAFTFVDRYPILCALEGCIHFTSSVVAISAPSMIAACRFYTVTNGVPSFPTNRFVRTIFLTKTSILCLIGGCWIYFFFITGFLLSFDQMGKCAYGFCGTKPFTSVPLHLFFLLAFVSFVFISTIFTIIYSTKLSRFVTKYIQFVESDKSDTNETKALLKMIKLAAAQPFTFQFLPLFCFILADLGLFNLSIPLGRVLALIFALAALIDPWLSIFILRPFQREFAKQISMKILRPRNTFKTTPIQLPTNEVLSGRKRMASSFVHN